jgi:hypothetical protein
MRVVARLACGAGGRIPESVCKKRLSTLVVVVSDPFFFRSCDHLNYTSGTFSLSTVHLPTRIPCQFRSEQPALPAPRLLPLDVALFRTLPTTDQLVSFSPLW